MRRNKLSLSQFNKYRKDHRRQNNSLSHLLSDEVVNTQECNLRLESSPEVIEISDDEVNVSDDEPSHHPTTKTSNSGDNEPQIARNPRDFQSSTQNLKLILTESSDEESETARNPPPRRFLPSSTQNLKLVLEESSDEESESSNSDNSSSEDSSDIEYIEDPKKVKINVADRRFERRQREKKPNAIKRPSYVELSDSDENITSKRTRVVERIHSSSSGDEFSQSVIRRRVRKR